MRASSRIGTISNSVLQYAGALRLDQSTSVRCLQSRPHKKMVDRLRPTDRSGASCQQVQLRASQFNLVASAGHKSHRCLRFECDRGISTLDARATSSFWADFASLADSDLRPGQAQTVNRLPWASGLNQLFKKLNRLGVVTGLLQKGRRPESRILA